MILGHTLCRCICSHTSPGRYLGARELSGQLWLHRTTTRCTSSSLSEILLDLLLYCGLRDEPGRDAGSVLFPLRALLAVLRIAPQAEFSRVLWVMMLLLPHGSDLSLLSP